MKKIDAIVTIATENWAHAVAVMIDGLAKHAKALVDRILVYHQGGMGAVKWWAKQRDARVEFHNIFELGEEPICPWKPRNPFDRLCYYKLNLLAAEGLGERVMWLDADVLILEDLSGLLQYEDYTAPEARGVKGPPDHAGHRGLSFGLNVFKPSAERVGRMLQFAETIKPFPCARDQNLVSLYMRTHENDRVTVLPREYHANTRMAHYQPDVWAGISPKRLLHYGGPKPWDKSSGNPALSPWHALFNQWIDAYNALEIGERMEHL